MPYRTDVEVGGNKTVIDDAQLKKLMSSSRSTVLQRNKFRIVTLTLIAINVIVFVIEVLLSGLRVNIPTGILVNMGAMYAPLIQSVGDLYRFVTPMFLHLDLMHLGFNMVALFSVGEVL
ncbi:MAG: rhomboid family intramembrane serine protease, partial [Raoultibacter sp.]